MSDARKTDAERPDGPTRGASSIEAREGEGTAPGPQAAPVSPALPRWPEPSDEEAAFAELAMRAAPAPWEPGWLPHEVAPRSEPPHRNPGLSSFGGYGLAEWGAVPPELRLGWCRAMLDFPPRFPGATVMVFFSEAIRADQPAAVVSWGRHADAFHRLGMSSDEWTVLRMAADRRRDDLLAQGDRLMVDTAPASTHDSFALVPAGWRDWLALRRAGLTPLRALDLIVDGDTSSWPKGRIVEA